MPTQKAPKATRKLRRKSQKVNNRRRNQGKKPLAFKHFYKTSHKRNRKQFESRNANKKDDIKPSPFKKRKLNNDNQQTSNAPFGFGDNMDENDVEYKRFLGDINDSDSDDDDDNDHDLLTETITTTNDNLSSTALIEQNNLLKQQTAAHQSDLNSLRDAHPEFYKHLTEIDGGNLLSFGDNDQFNLAELSDIDDVIEDIQNESVNKTKKEINDIKDDDDDDLDDQSNDNNTNTPDTNDNDEDSDDDLDGFLDDDVANDDDVDDVKFSDGGSDYDTDDDDDLIDDIIDDTMFALNVNDLKQLIDEFENQKSLNAMKQILNGFCSFVESTMDDNKSGTISKRSVAVANNLAFQELLNYCLTKIAPSIISILDITSKQQTQPQRIQTNNNKYIPYRSTFSKYFKYLYAFFKTITDESMQRLFLIHSRDLVFIIISMNDSIKRLYIKYITSLWSSGTPNVRIDAFIFLHEYGKRLHNSNSNELTLLFKYMYQSYIIICKRVSVTTLPGINFMINCLTEIYKLNPVISYKDAFKRLRSIAFHVKQSIQIMAKHQTNNQSTKVYHSKKIRELKLETIRMIYNWRFINIIKLWSKVLASHSNIKNSDLYLLYYPFIQISISVLTLTRSAAYDPGRLKIIKSLLYLINVSQSSDIADRRIYVPLAPYLISIINNPAFAKKTKDMKKNKKKNKKTSSSSSSDNNGVIATDIETTKTENQNKFNILYKIRVSDADFETDYLHSTLLNSATKCMIEYFSYYSYSISFPEIIFPTQIFLGQFLSSSNIPNYMKTKIKLLNIKLKENANWINSKRKNVDFSPKDFEKIYAFLSAEKSDKISPLDKFIKSNQFKNILNRNNNNNKKKINNNNNKNKNKLNNKKQKKLLKKQKKWKSKHEMKLKQDLDAKNKKIVNDLKINYQKKIKNKDNGVVVTGLGDVVKDFQFSDDDT